MNQREFLQTLQNRAKEQKMLTEALPFPKVFAFIGTWLGNHPWRILIPIALIITLIFHAFYGNSYDTFILKLFGGFGFISLY